MTGEHRTKDERVAVRDELFLMLNNLLPQAESGQVLRLVQLIAQLVTSELPSNGQSDAIEQLKRFYSVETLEQLVIEQNRHVEKLQSRLTSPTDSFRPRHAREG